MCGRFTIISDPIEYQMEFDIQLNKDNWKPRYNVSPTQSIPTVNNADKRTIETMQWGIVPAWSSADKKQIQIINVRSETILEKMFFRRLMQQGQRCLILSDGFYEWQAFDKKGQPKIPYYFHLKNRKPFAFAGIWDPREMPDNQTLKTCAIMTCAPNSLVGAIHNRMPVILDSGSSWEWLDNKPLAQLLPLLKPYDESKMVSFPVNPFVNNPNTDIPECVLPASS